MKKILTVGVFDYFHYGHLRLFQRCRQYGDYLIVAVQDSSQILINKPDAKPLYTTEQRVEMVSAIKYVDEVVIYNQVDDDIKNIDFDVFIVGGDQTHSGFVKAIEYAKSCNKEVIRLERTPNICSSDIKKDIKKGTE